jgi:hypothetical protein
VALRIDAGALEEVPVTEGITDGQLVQVAGGLRSGDVIVSDARQDFTEGATNNPVLPK